MNDIIIIKQKARIKRISFLSFIISFLLYKNDLDILVSKKIEAINGAEGNKKIPIWKQLKLNFLYFSIKIIFLYNLISLESFNHEMILLKYLNRFLSLYV